MHIYIGERILLFMKYFNLINFPLLFIEILLYT
jgi:hypothetical protein